MLKCLSFFNYDQKLAMCLFEERLNKRKMAGNLRKLKREKNCLIDFASNDYLGLAKENALQVDVGSTGSRLLTGNTRFVEMLEEEIAHFHGYQAGLIFTSGYT